MAIDKPLSIEEPMDMEFMEGPGAEIEVPLLDGPSAIVTTRKTEGLLLTLPLKMAARSEKRLRLMPTSPST